MFMEFELRSAVRAAGTAEPSLQPSPTVSPDLSSLETLSLHCRLSKDICHPYPGWVTLITSSRRKNRNISAGFEFGCLSQWPSQFQSPENVCGQPFGIILVWKCNQ